MANQTNPNHELLELIFKDITVETADSAIEKAKATLLEEADAYRVTLEILKNHDLQDAEVYEEVRINSSRLDEIEKTIDEGKHCPELDYAKEIIQLNTLDKLI